MTEPTHFSEENAFKPAMTPKPDDAKPDPLEELRAVDDVYVETCTSCMANKPLVHAAIAAWEKERAELIHQRREATRQVERNAALRAAIYDALDAALRGEGRDFKPDIESMEFEP